MPVKIRNLTVRPVLLTLTTGQTLRLAPGETSAQLGDVEVQNNPKLQKLQERRVIALHDVKESGGKRASTGKKAGRSKPSTPAGSAGDNKPARTKKKAGESSAGSSDSPPREGER